MLPLQCFVFVFFFTEVREKKWSRCTSVNPATSQCITEPVMQSRFVQERGYVNSASSAMQQQSNEIKMVCSLAANHVEAICFDAIPTSPNKGCHTPQIICHISGIYDAKHTPVTAWDSEHQRITTVCDQ